MGAQSTIEWTDASWTPIRARAKAGLDGVEHNGFPQQERKAA